jgi:hypothetical protein
MRRWKSMDPLPWSNSLLISCIAQVFQCEHSDCGHFYHPRCIAQLLYPPGSEEAALFEVEVAAAREKFTCPMHECIVCKGVEDKNDRNMQFAVCRRCPTAYHRQCLPRFVSLITEMPLCSVPFLYILLWNRDIFFLTFLCLLFAVKSFSNQEEVPMGSKGRGTTFYLTEF